MFPVRKHLYMSTINITDDLICIPLAFSIYLTLNHVNFGISLITSGNLPSIVKSAAIVLQYIVINRISHNLNSKFIQILTKI